MRREQGAVTLFGMIMIMLLSAMGATLLTLSKTNLEIAVNHRDGIAAQYLAEAGVQYAITRLKTDQDFVSQTGLESYSITSESLGNAISNGNYMLKVGPDSVTTNKNTRMITAVGTVNQAKRQVIVNVTIPTSIGEGTPFVMIWEN